VKSPFQLRHRNFRQEAGIKVYERQAKLRAEPVHRQRRHSAFCKHMIGRRQNGRQIIHQRPRPIKDDVANHPSSLPSERALQSAKFAVRQAGSVSSPQVFPSLKLKPLILLDTRRRDGGGARPEGFCPRHPEPGGLVGAGAQEGGGEKIAKNGEFFCCIPPGDSQ